MSNVAFLCVFAQCTLGYGGGNTTFQDVVNGATGDLFCAATPSPDASQVQTTTVFMTKHGYTLLM